MEFLYLVFTRIPGESYRRRLRSLLLYLCYVFRALIISLACYFCCFAFTVRQVIITSVSGIRTVITLVSGVRAVITLVSGVRTVITLVSGARTCFHNFRFSPNLNYFVFCMHQRSKANLRSFFLRRPRVT